MKVPKTSSVIANYFYEYDFEASRIDLRNQISGDAISSTALYLLATLTFYHEGSEQSLKLYNEAIGRDPENENYWFDYIDALLNANHIQGADAVIAQSKSYISQKGLEVHLLPKLEFLSAVFTAEESGSHHETVSNWELERLSDLYNSGNITEAHKASEQLLLQYPNCPYLLNIAGCIASDSNNSCFAISCLKKAITALPSFQPPYINLANELNEIQKIVEANQFYRKSLWLDKRNPEANHNYSIFLQRIGREEVALEHSIAAVMVNPLHFRALNTSGVTWNKLGYREIAKNCFKESLKITPNFSDALFNMGNSLAFSGPNLDALGYIDAAILYEPGHVAARALRMRMKAEICEWDSYAEDVEWLRLNPNSTRHTSPFGMLPFYETAKLQYGHAISFSQYNYPIEDSAVVFESSRGKSKIRVAYVSGDYQKHPVSYLMQSVLEKHDRFRFEIYGVSLKTFSDEMTKKIENSVDKYIDLSGNSDEEAISILRAMEIDIAVDLTGNTKEGRPKLFHKRISPIQISYLGYPGTMGTHFYDYIIADQVILPKEHQEYYTETPVYLPICYQAQNDQLDIAESYESNTVARLNVFEFVFCAINNTYKISPLELDVWSRILHRVPHSCLWLYAPSRLVADNLTKGFEQRGIANDRIIFSGRKPHDIYLAGFKHAHLFLDTFLYNAGATASNALWAGLPLVTRIGDSYPSRMAASILHGIGLEELVTHSIEEYEELAVKLALDKDSLNRIRTKLKENKTETKFFSSSRFARVLESSFEQVVQKHRMGDHKSPIYVS
jgi:protein O-GlcNAc transferase